MLVSPPRAYAQTPEPPAPKMPPLPQGLDPPPTVYPPTQVSLGSQVYYQVCMACHGDRGQGLTDAWRGALDPPDQNCWQSRCHAPNHPPGGFVFPKVVPAVISPAMVARFADAQELHDFIQSQMPWQAPGSLKADEYWQLTAFLVSANGIDPGLAPLGPQNAVNIRMRPVMQMDIPASSTGPFQPWMLAVGLGILLAIGYLLVQLHRIRRSSME